MICFKRFSFCGDAQSLHVFMDSQDVPAIFDLAQLTQEL